MNKPIVVEKYADNGQISHYEFVDPLTGTCVGAYPEDHPLFDVETIISYVKTMVPDQYGMIPKHQVISFIRSLKFKL